jgi:hypothetical protein
MVFYLKIFKQYYAWPLYNKDAHSRHTPRFDKLKVKIAELHIRMRNSKSPKRMVGQSVDFAAICFRKKIPRCIFQSPAHLPEKVMNLHAIKRHPKVKCTYTLIDTCNRDELLSLNTSLFLHSHSDHIDAIALILRRILYL